MRIAIIPARGGSKRIPEKNIKPFAGKPIIYYSIEAARKSGLFDMIIVSTDSESIASVARNFGATIPFIRPDELSTDTASTEDVIIHAIDSMRKIIDTIDYVCCIYATAPFIQECYLTQGLDLLISSQATTAFSVTTFPYPIYRALQITEHNKLSMIWPEYMSARSQDLPEVYHDAGQFYWLDVNSFLLEKKLYSSNSIPVIIPRYYVQDIDTIEDWIQAEAMFKILNNNYKL